MIFRCWKCLVNIVYNLDIHKTYRSTLKAVRTYFTRDTGWRFITGGWNLKIWTCCTCWGSAVVLGWGTWNEDSFSSILILFWNQNFSPLWRCSLKILNVNLMLHKEPRQEEISIYFLICILQFSKFPFHSTYSLQNTDTVSSPSFSICGTLISNLFTDYLVICSVESQEWIAC